MAYIKEKTIAGRKYFYVTKSVRLPDGKVKTLQKLVKDRRVSPQAFAGWFEEEEKKAFCGWAAKTYPADSVFSAEQIRAAEEMRFGYRKILARLSKPQLKDLFDRFTVNFTYESNAIEGNSLTLKDVAIVLFENASIKGKDLREIYETRNSRKVVDLILRRKLKATEADAIRVHKTLVRDMDIPTGYKTVPNYLLGRDVETTPPEKVAGAMGKLFADYEANEGKLHPVQLAARFHGAFEKIHPFEDGNGRVGRFLVNAMLVNNGYPPLIIRKSQRTAYMKCLNDFDRGYARNLERFLLEKYKDTYRKFFEVYAKYLK